MLPHTLALKVRHIPGGFTPPVDGTWPPTRFYIVVSQDCDIACDNFDHEPVVEVVLAKKIKTLKGSLEHLRSPRTLHVALTKPDGTMQPVEIDVRYRGHVSHSLLLEHTPSDELRADPAIAIELATMVSRRYLRGARPDSFDARVAPAKPQIEALLDREVRAKVLFDIMLLIEPLAELDANAEYTVTVYGVLMDSFDDRDKRETREQIDALADELNNLLMQCDGIFVDHVEIVGRAQISLRQAEYLRSFEIVWPRLSAEADGDENDEDLEASK